MTDNTDPNAELPPENPIILDANGDPLRQGSLMNEKQSYERIVDGLQVMAEASAHMAQRDKNRRQKLLEITIRLDVVRVTAVRKAGISEPMKQRDTVLTPNPPMAWKEARKRFRDGSKQAAGGFRQLATCHRGELLWSRMAVEVERLADNVNKGAINMPSARRSGLILPETVH